MTQNEIGVVGATKFAVGLSQIIRVTPTAYQYAQSVKILSGGGTLEIVGVAFSGSSTAAGTSTVGWGTGYPIGAAEVVSVGGPAVFYLAATGATMVAVMLIGQTVGATAL